MTGKHEQSGDYHMNTQLSWAREGPNQHWRAEVALPPLYFRAEIVPNEDEDDDEGAARFLLVVHCEVWDVNAYDEQVAHESSPLPDFGEDSDPNNDAGIEAMALDMVMSLNVTAHASVRGALAATEEDLKRLRAIEHVMSRVTLTDTNGGGKRVTLTPDLARMILAQDGTSIKRPWRIELEAPNLAACYNEQGFVIGRIKFRPDANPQPETTERAGRLGLFLYHE